MSSANPERENLPGADQASAPSICSALSREQWLARCADHLRKRGALDAVLAMQIAEAQLENLKDDLSENPEEAAEDEMSYWTAD